MSVLTVPSATERAMVSTALEIALIVFLLPFTFSTMAIPSITVAEGLGISSGVVDSFISSLARVDLLVVLLSPSGVAKAHGMGHEDG